VRAVAPTPLLEESTVSTLETPAQPETFRFQAETRQLLDIVVHSLYSEKEIFLRELISNASDALDRLRFEAFAQPELLEGAGELEIWLEPDAAGRTLTIRDNGIGMSRHEVVENLGTIAKSGTREVLAQAKESGTSNLAQLIGQFGVGFYSAFMVAERVEVLTRRAGEAHATKWESRGDGEFTVSEAERPGTGTTITLHLKPVDEEHGLPDFTDRWVLRRLVKRSSDFVAYPIKTREERSVPRRDDKGEIVAGEYDSTVEEVTLNSRTPLWMRPHAEVGKEEYAELYRHISHDWNEPLDVVPLRAEGRLEYRALLFIPSTAPPGLFYRDQQFGLQLYVRRVLILERCEELLPPYLRFVRGVVDSDDLPLNVSREMVQQDRHLAQMRKWLTRKIVDHLVELSKNDTEKFATIWKHFGRVLKEGVAGDPEVRDRLVPLLRFPSSHDPEALVDFAGYRERMKEGQEEIYYLTGESRVVVESSPHLEAFKAKGYEVLYLLDPVDELVAEALPEVEGKKLRSVGKGDVEIGSEEERKETEAKLEAKKSEVADLLTALGKHLETWISEVRLSARLTSSPACLVGREGDISPHLERLLREAGNAEGFEAPKRILELNPDHPVLAKLQQRFAGASDAEVDDLAHLLYGYALLAEGSELPDPGRFHRLLAELMAKGL
jgi:molecular chaperone HtpG